MSKMQTLSKILAFFKKKNERKLVVNDSYRQILMKKHDLIAWELKMVQELIMYHTSNQDINE